MPFSHGAAACARGVLISICALLYFGDETIAPAGDGRDIATVLGALSKRFAQGRDIHGEVHFLDESIWPYFFQELIFREQPPLIAHQAYEGVKNLRRKR